MPQLSVVVPVYNAEEVLRYCVNSILNQTFIDFELLLIDDGSTDNSPAICDELAKKDNRIKVIHKENGGAGSARNKGIEIATGKYIAFPDADDYLEPDMFACLIKRILIEKVDLAMCLFNKIHINPDFSRTIISDFTLFDKTVKTKSECHKIWFEIRKSNIGILNSPWNKIYRLDIIKNNNIIFPDLRRAQDAVFNIVYYDKISSVSVINECLYNYVANDENKIGKKYPKDVYRCFFELDRIIVNTVKKWDMYYGEYKSLCDNHLLGILDECVRMIDNPIWHLSKKEKIDYLNQLISDTYLKQQLKKYEGYVYEIEDLIKPVLKGDSKYVLKALRIRKIKDIVRKTFLIKLWRNLKTVYSNFKHIN